jgi:hypothetical protein
MSPDKTIQAAPGHENDARPIRTAGAVIYGTFALLLVTIPQSLVNRLGDMESGPAQQSLLSAAEALQAASHMIGLDAPYIRARAMFFALAGKNDD